MVRDGRHIAALPSQSPVWGRDRYRIGRPDVSRTEQPPRDRAAGPYGVNYYRYGTRPIAEPWRPLHMRGCAVYVKHEVPSSPDAPLERLFRGPKPCWPWPVGMFGCGRRLAGASWNRTGLIQVSDTSSGRSARSFPFPSSAVAAIPGGDAGVAGAWRRQPSWSRRQTRPKQSTAVSRAGRRGAARRDRLRLE